MDGQLVCIQPNREAKLLIYHIVFIWSIDDQRWHLHSTSKGPGRISLSKWDFNDPKEQMDGYSNYPTTGA